MPDAPKALSWDDFRLVRSVAETGSLPAGAAALGLNHSTVFRRLRQIEAMLGLALFERHRSGFVATPAGEEILATATRMDLDVTDVLRRLSGQALGPAGELRITTSDSLLVQLLLPLFARFREACPRITLDLVVGNAESNLSRRDADIAIRATDSAPETLVGRRLGRIAWALYGRAAYVGVPVQDLVAQANWVGLGESMGTLKATQFLQKQITPTRVAARVNSVLALAEAVEAGLGIGHLPCFVGDVRPGLQRLHAPEPAFGSTLWVLTHPDLRQSPRVRAMLDFLAPAITPLRDLLEGRQAGAGGLSL